MDLGFLRALYEHRQGEHPGYVSVYLDVSPGTESAATEVALRWRSARGRLAAAGADEATLDATERAVTERAAGARGRAVFATGGAVRLSGTVAEPPASEISRWGPLPHVVPWLEQRPPRVAHVRVAADRKGGRVLAVPSDREAGATSVAGSGRCTRCPPGARRRRACSARPKNYQPLTKITRADPFSEAGPEFIARCRQLRHWDRERAAVG